VVEKKKKKKGRRGKIRPRGFFMRPELGFDGVIGLPERARKRPSAVRSLEDP